MNINEKFIITINRQFGTGGHEVGAALAEKLGVKLLDKQLLQAVAHRFNADDEMLEKLQARNPSHSSTTAILSRPNIISAILTSLHAEFSRLRQR